MDTSALQTVITDLKKEFQELLQEQQRLRDATVANDQKRSENRRLLASLEDKLRQAARGKGKIVDMRPGNTKRRKIVEALEELLRFGGRRTPELIDELRVQDIKLSSRNPHSTILKAMKRSGRFITVDGRHYLKEFYEKQLAKQSG